MDIKRSILLVALAVVAYLLVLQWNQDYGQTALPSTTSTTQSSTPALPETSSSPAGAPDVPPLPNSQPEQSLAVAQPSQQLIRVRTDVLEVAIDPRGGDIVELLLTQYPRRQDRPDVPFQLFERSGERTYEAQSGLIGDGPDQANGRPLYSSAKTQYTLDEGQEQLVVDLTYSADGINYTKRFTFERGDYDLGVRYLIDNQSNEPWTGYLFGQLKRDNSSDPSSSTATGTATYLGAAMWTKEDSYRKISRGDMDETAATLYAGPKIQGKLEELAPGLRLTVDYGILWFIAQPIFWLLSTIHSLLGNWGWSIIVLTLIIKLAFFPLSAASYKSMARMRAVSPKMQALKEQFGDDRQKMSQAMMELYKKERINPLGGCLPILVQMPVFLALYWVLLESVEMRQAPWMFWITDLSVKDPYFILPIIMGVTMFLQQQLNPTPPDPMQAKVMKLLPIIFTFFFLWFPAGLVLYWVVNNVLSIAQQWYITRRIEASGKTA